MAEKKLLICIDWFEPAFKAGGPIRTVSNMIRLLIEHYDVHVYTGDRDLGDESPMAGIKVDEWTTRPDGVRILYTSPGKRTLENMRSLIRELNPDAIYCSGIYSWYFNAMALMAAHAGMKDARVVLAPHGMLKPSALAHKTAKKKLYLTGLRLMGLHKGLRFHATDAGEAADIVKIFPRAEVQQMMDCPAPIPDSIIPLKKEPGALRILFVGRIHPIKNLSWVLETLQQVTGQVTLTVVGLMEVPAYWESCKKAISGLPATVTVNVIGELEHGKILGAVNDHHLLFLPTQGENFGHAIYEALSMGRPALISDQTPWRQLRSAGAGWDLPLQDRSAFVDAVNTAVAWDQSAFDEACANARTYVSRNILFEQLLQSYLNLFS